jgi:hypothetical protein
VLATIDLTECARENWCRCGHDAFVIVYRQLYSSPQNSPLRRIEQQRPPHRRVGLLRSAAAVSESTPPNHPWLCTYWYKSLNMPVPTFIGIPMMMHSLTPLMTSCCPCTDASKRWSVVYMRSRQQTLSNARHTLPPSQKMPTSVQIPSCGRYRTE